MMTPISLKTPDYSPWFSPQILKIKNSSRMTQSLTASSILEKIRRMTVYTITNHVRLRDNIL